MLPVPTSAGPRTEAKHARARGWIRACPSLHSPRHDTGTRMALSPSAQSIIETRRPQMFPTLEASEIERVRRFGEVCAYPAGHALARVGAVPRGFTIILSGHVDITQHDENGQRTLIV